MKPRTRPLGGVNPWAEFNNHGKMVRFGDHVKPKVLRRDDHARPKQTTNKEDNFCTLFVRREKKKHKQSITNDNPTIIYLHTPHYVKKGTVAHPVKGWMAKFGLQ